jgi:hypothetical protein
MPHRSRVRHPISPNLRRHLHPEKPVDGRAALRSVLFSRSLDENPPHRLSGGGKEMSTTIPFLSIMGNDQPNVGFVDECRGLQRVIGRFLRHAGGGEFAQFFIHQWQQPLRGLRVSAFDGRKNLSDVAHRRPVCFGVVSRQSRSYGKCEGVAHRSVGARRCRVKPGGSRN